MNQVAFSNLCNLISQQLGFLGYHRGYESDIYRNIDNNTNQGNLIGNRYPFVLLEPIPTVADLRKGVSTDNNIRINFFDLQHYDNNADMVARATTSLIQTQNLLNLAYNFVYALQGIGKSLKFQIKTETAQFETLESQTNDRLLQVVATFTAYWYEECPLLPFDPSAVLPPYTWPPLDDVDYETLTTP